MTHYLLLVRIEKLYDATYYKKHTMAIIRQVKKKNKLVEDKTVDNNYFIIEKAFDVVIV
jgi:hypothetical protein